MCLILGRNLLLLFSYKRSEVENKQIYLAILRLVNFMGKFGNLKG
ncbi:hypothetical protein [uncultured Campylobacter sp.]|nr:hypothetical protein [uncultured Campylobacter sp.]